METGSQTGPISTLPALLRARAATGPAAPLLLAPGREPLDADGLLEHTAGVAGALARVGVGSADRVALVLPNGPEAASAFLACASVCACAPLNPAYRRQELEFYLSDLDARALVVAAELDTPARTLAVERGIPILELEVAPDAEAGRFELRSVAGARRAEGPLRQADPGTVALVLHTSGTTARPKMVPLTHANLCASARAIAATLALSPGDRCLNVMPLFHIHGLVGALLASLAGGGSVACAPGFAGARFLDWLEEVEPTWYTAVPTIHQGVLAQVGERGAEAADAPLRLIRSSSASLPPPVMARLEDALGVPVIESYGMTEAAHQMTSNPLPPRTRKPGSVGPAAGPEVTVLDGEGNELAPGSVGEVAIRGESVFSGYANDPEANASAFAGTWFRTGDEGFLDDDGYLVLRGRIKELINRAGEKISPREVDEALLAHAEVAEALAFALPDQRVGEEVAAAVVLRPGATASEGSLQRFAAERLADFKVPRRIVLLDELPKGATGKAQRLGLAERLGLSRAPGAPGGEPPVTAGSRPETAGRVAAAIAEVLDLDEVGVAEDFFALGGDSLAAAALVSRLALEFPEAELPLASLVWAPTAELLAAELEVGGRAPEAGLAVPLRSDGDGPPIFLVHGQSGEIVGLAGLARRLTRPRPVYALRPPEADDQRPRPTIADVASLYLGEIRAVQPAGPYRLGGFCLGGVIALAIADRLAREGEEIEPLVLIDPPVGRRWLEGSLSYAAGRVALHARQRELLPWLGRKLRHRTLGLSPEPPPADERERFLRALARATREEGPPARFAGEALVVASSEYDVPRSYWRSRIAGGLSWRRIRAPHEELLRGKNLGRVAAAVEQALAPGRSRSGLPSGGAGGRSPRGPR